MTMDRTAPAVIVIGDVITDLVVQLRQALVVASDTASTISMRPGGSGANQAAWLAYIAPQLNVHFVGCVGQDPFGAYHDVELRRSGVLPHLGVDPQRSTGTIVVLVDGDGERSMLTDRGANLGLRVEDLPTEVFQPGACLHLSGYTLADPRTRTVARTAIGLARDHAMIVSVDPASASLLRDIGPHRFLEWTRGADLCFPNLDEGRLLSGETDPEAAARSAQAGSAGGAVGARRRTHAESDGAADHSRRQHRRGRRLLRGLPGLVARGARRRERVSSGHPAGRHGRGAGRSTPFSLIARYVTL